MSDTPTPALLREPAHQVSPRARWMWTISGAAEMLFLVALPQVIWLLIDRTGRSLPGARVPIAIGSAILAVLYVIAMPQWRFRVHRWEATPSAIYTQTGWLSQERRIAPASRVQTVDLRRGPVAQLLGLASVRVTTASAAGPLEIAGLSLADASTLVESLTVAAETAGDDAT